METFRRVVAAFKARVRRMLGRVLYGGYARLYALALEQRSNYLDQVQIGRHTYGYSAKTFYLPTGRESVTIGSFCSIAAGVQFIFGDHPLDKVSTYPLRYSLRKDSTNNDAVCRGLITVGNDVWLGRNALIMANVRIGDGAVVAAGSVVTRDVPPYAVVGGVPARIIKTRFTGDQIEQLRSIAWWNWPDTKILQHIDLFYSNVDSFIEAFAPRTGSSSASS